MINKEFIFSKIKELEESPKGDLLFKNNNIYLDLLNLTWQSKELLRRYGVSASLATKFINYYGRIGEEAKTALKKVVLLTAEDIQILFKASIRVSTQEVSEQIGNDVFKELPDPVQVVLVSLWRQFGRLSEFDSPALAMATKMMVRGHIKMAIHYLKDEKGWSTAGREFMSLRLKEVKILEKVIGEDK
jgi:hypothetical protein